jgi:hypothetical protein
VAAGVGDGSPEVDTAEPPAVAGAAEGAGEATGAADALEVADGLAATAEAGAAEGGTTDALGLCPTAADEKNASARRPKNAAASARRALRRGSDNGVISTRIAGMALGDPLGTHPRATHQAIAIEGLLRVARAGRLEAAP